jgi:DNA repair photolyase
MTVLLEAGVEVAFLTKGFITGRFVKLFTRTPQRVFAQIGITTLDHTLWKALEPRASPPEQRLATVAALSAAGIRVSARLDPLVPDLTDTPEQLRPLLGQLRQAGITRAAVSYLFLRPPFANLLLTQLQAIQPALSTAAQWRYAAFREGAGGRMLDERERNCRYASISALAAEAGMEIDVCACKNPWHAGPGCQIAGPASISPAHQSGLFPMNDA